MSLRKVNTTMVGIVLIGSASSLWSSITRTCECGIIRQYRLQSHIYIFEINANINWKRWGGKFDCGRSGLHGGLINMGCAPSLPLRSHARGSRQSSTASLPNNAPLVTDNCQQQHKDSDVTTSSLHIVFTSNDRTPVPFIFLFLSFFLKYSYSVYQSLTHKLL